MKYLLLILIATLMACHRPSAQTKQLLDENPKSPPAFETAKRVRPVANKQAQTTNQERDSNDDWIKDIVTKITLPVALKQDLKTFTLDAGLITASIMAWPKIIQPLFRHGALVESLVTNTRPTPLTSTQQQRIVNSFKTTAALRRAAVNVVGGSEYLIVFDKLESDRLLLLANVVETESGTAAKAIDALIKAQPEKYHGMQGKMRYTTRALNADQFAKIVAELSSDKLAITTVTRRALKWRMTSGIVGTAMAWAVAGHVVSDVINVLERTPTYLD